MGRVYIYRLWTGGLSSGLSGLNYRNLIIERCVMRLFFFVLMQILVFLPVAGFAADAGTMPISQNHNKTEATASQKAGVIKSYGKLPLYFIENRGQVDNPVKFYERGAGHATFFTSKGVVIGLTKKNVKVDKTARHDKIKALEVNKNKDRNVTTETVSLSFVGANTKAKIVAGDKKTGKVNYFVGNDNSKWRTNISTYGAVTYKDVYEKIDIKFYGNNRQLEHDVIVRPHGDISKVKFAYKGIQSLKVTKDGGLEVTLNNGKLIEKKPIIYQELNGKRAPVKGSYRIFKSNKENFAYGFTVASYDHTKKIVIDPVLVYSTYLGGTDNEYGNGIAVDNMGAAYITGYTGSTDFPLMNPIQGICVDPVSCTDAFITKINPGGTALVYSTYLGGNTIDIAYGIAVDSAGAAYITGYTASTDFPLMNPIQGVGGGVIDAFITKLNPAGSALVYSTYLGGSISNISYGIAVDSSGSAYVTGETASTDFPLMNPIQVSLLGTQDAFITKLNPAGSAFVYSTYLGGTTTDSGRGIAVDSSGSAYVTGETGSTDFPLMSPIQGTCGGVELGFCADAFVTKINPAGSAIVYSTYLGGSGPAGGGGGDRDYGRGIAVDSSGSAYVTGQTYSTSFPLMNPIQGTIGSLGYSDAFITRLTPAGSAFVYSTYLGGSSEDIGYGIAVDSSGSAYVTGETYSTDFPLMNPIQVIGGGIFNPDAFVTKINSAGSALVYSTYLGGSNVEYGGDIAVDLYGSAYVMGDTGSTDFPLMNPLQGIFGGGTDAFVTKISGTPLPVVHLSIIPDVISVARGSILGYTLTITNTTAAIKCFQYWENVTLPGGFIFPGNGAGSIFQPVPFLCFNAGDSHTVHLAHRIPFIFPLGTYSFNAYDGLFPPAFRLVVDSASFNFDVTPFGTSPLNPHASRPLIEKGFKK